MWRAGLPQAQFGFEGNELEQKELFKGEPAFGRLGLAKRRGKVRFADRRSPFRKVLRSEDFFGEKFGLFLGEFYERLNQKAQPPRGEPFGFGIDRNEAAGVDRLGFRIAPALDNFVDGIGKIERVRAVRHLARKPHLVSLFHVPYQKRLVKPDGFYRGGFILNDRLGQHHPPARRAVVCDI